MEDNTAFEWMMKFMELGVVLGIGVVVWFIKSQQKKGHDEGHILKSEHKDAGSDHD